MVPVPQREPLGASSDPEAAPVAACLVPSPPSRAIARSDSSLSSQEVSIHVTTVNLLVADRAIAIARRSQIMKGRRYDADDLRRAGCLLRQIGMALQANETDFGSRQHLRICRTMRFVTCLAAFSSHGGVFKCERTTQVGVTFEATRLIRGKRANLFQ